MNIFQERRKSAIKDCTRAVELDGGYTKVVLRRATLQEEEDLLDEALKDYQRVLELDPSSQEAIAAVQVSTNIKYCTVEFVDTVQLFIKNAFLISEFC